MKAGAAGPFLAALLAALLLTGPTAWAAAPVSWAAYRAAAARAGAAAAHSPYRPPAGSALRAAAVRWPDGTVSPLQPQPLIGGLRQPPTTAQGAMSRAVLARIAATPAIPAPPVDGRRLRTAWGRLLRQPAFARLHPGLIAQIETAVSGLARRLLAGLWTSLRVWLGGASGLGGPALALAGAAGLVAAAWGIVVLVRRGFEPRLRATGRQAPAIPPAPPPESLLAQGDTVGAVRAAYRQLLEVARRQGVDVRPGWTAARLLAAAPQTRAWPGFADFARFHDRICFGPTDGPRPSPSEAERWLREVRRWQLARLRQDAAG